MRHDYQLHALCFCVHRCLGGKVLDIPPAASLRIAGNAAAKEDTMVSESLFSFEDAIIAITRATTYSCTPFAFVSTGTVG